nr:hypothetical protein [Metabacillus lacus]
MKEPEGRKKGEILDLLPESQQSELNIILQELSFTKNFRSATAEEWYIFIPGYTDTRTGGAAGKAFLHYNLMGNRDIMMNTTILIENEELCTQPRGQMVYAICEEIVNRLAGYADTLLSVHAGINSYDAVYKQPE